MTLSKINYDSPKLPQLVAQTLINAIESGQIQVGQELPSERDMAEMLGVSRGPLRECLAILEFLGAIQKRGYRKIVLRGADYIRKIMAFVEVSAQADTQDEFNEYRKINEMAIVSLACERATDADLDSIEAALLRMENDPDDIWADADFHDALANASHNTMLSGTIHLVNSMIADLHNCYSDFPDFTQAALASHKAIFAAVKAKDSAAAQAEMKHHLEIINTFRDENLI